MPPDTKELIADGRLLRALLSEMDCGSYYSKNVYGCHHDYFYNGYCACSCFLPQLGTPADEKKEHDDIGKKF